MPDIRGIDNPLFIRAVCQKGHMMRRRIPLFTMPFLQGSTGWLPSVFLQLVVLKPDSLAQGRLAPPEPHEVLVPFLCLLLCVSGLTSGLVSCLVYLRTMCLESRGAFCTYAQKYACIYMQGESIPRSSILCRSGRCKTGRTCERKTQR